MSIDLSLYAPQYFSIRGISRDVIIQSDKLFVYTSLGIFFDKRLAAQHEQLEKTEKKLTSLRTEYEKRLSDREKIIDNEINSLVEVSEEDQFPGAVPQPKCGSINCERTRILKVFHDPINPPKHKSWKLEVDAEGRHFTMKKLSYCSNHPFWGQTKGIAKLCPNTVPVPSPYLPEGESGSKQTGGVPNLPSQ